ncbi:tRNA lysidine(34) synthetase TilS [Cellulosimicrobium sp. I38E]|uniref:tRNA lysidine(34) synthetase TilS n=1 Tax=Cellulosimicrobium TaxID=157920 RepID=UPI0007B22D19|nr:tRNA lysidine(34) synthetase TilS [Cellulosimicrobium sp. I38E]KZM79436.1 tRNA(Ile)-lysidine synthetase [Cellulosimicrobium sp. I38E]
MGGPAPVVATARRAVRRTLGDLRPGDLVLVACSGGADSTALAAATAFVAPRLGLRAGAVVVDHGLQAGSAGVAADAADRCRGLGLDPVEVRRVVVPASGDGPEADARAARYAALDAAATEHGAAAVLLGHTLDDQAETVLLGLARGAGARSLAGMAPRRGVHRRPLLALRRAETEAVCRTLGLVWWDDPTNGPAASGDAPGAPGTAALPLRSQVRARVVPALVDVLGPGAVPALARTADLLRDDADLLDALAADLLATALVASPDDGERGPAASGAESVVLDAEVLASAHPALRRRALRSAALRAGCPASDLFAVHVDALDALVTAWRGQGPVHLPGDLRATRACGRLSLGRETTPRRSLTPRTLSTPTPTPQE